MDPRILLLFVNFDSLTPANARAPEDLVVFTRKSDYLDITSAPSNLRIIPVTIVPLFLSAIIISCIQ